MRSPYEVGLRLAAGAAGLWIVALVAGGPDVFGFLGLATILVGFVVAARAAGGERGTALPLGFLAVAAGVILFYRGDLWSSIYNVAGLLFAAGTALAAAGEWRDTVLVHQLGLLVAAVGGLVWVYADLGAWWWQPGNALMTIGCTAAAWGVGRR